jgi:hypothetical protein
LVVIDEKRGIPVAAADCKLPSPDCYSPGLLLFRKARKEVPNEVALALVLVLAGSSFAVGLVSTDANAGARKTCKQILMRHPMRGEHSDLMKRCKAEYRAYKKAHGART